MKLTNALFLVTHPPGTYKFEGTVGTTKYEDLVCKTPGLLIDTPLASMLPASYGELSIVDGDRVSYDSTLSASVTLQFHHYVEQYKFGVF